MSDLVEPRFEASEQAILDEIEDRLHALGWASHATATWLMRGWQKLARSVDRYTLTVDDYTNDLTARDGLEIILAHCPEPLCAKLRLAIETADKEFLARTQEDLDHALERYFRIDESFGWWWRRRPTSGQLADYLSK
ncbi:MAG TPA: hypothetical protein VEU06_00410 [Micropepsaceae bacterium]|nr:hypothetical protein [Micropepsaceae bacterium]